MKKTIRITLASLVLTVISHAGLTPLGEHIDVRATYDRNADTWTCHALTAGTGGSEVTWDFDTVFLPLSDRPYSASTPSASGARHVQPVSSAYTFTGVAPGNPIWIAVQGTPGIGEAWPGFENAQGSGIFGEYLEADTRLAQPQTLARPWIRIALESVAYQGAGNGPAFSMWTVSGSSPRVWMSTADGLDDGDCFLYAAGSHVHLNWGFSAPGIYRLRFTASAFRGPGKTNPTAESGIFTLTFAVGPLAQWQAARFNGVELEDAGICGPRADPDHDGLVNLTEYAFGLDPRNAGRVPESTGLGLPELTRESTVEILEYPRRRAGQLTAPLGYSAEFSGLVPGESWQADGVESVSGFTGGEAALNGIWEKVRVTREVPAGKSSGFGRVRLEQGE